MHSAAAKKIKLSDTRYSFTTKAEEIRLEDVEGHVIQLREAKGVDVGSRLLAVSTSTFDLVKGNGALAGYTTLMGPDGAAIAYLKQEGKVTTTLSAVGTPAVTAEGTWSLVEGVGEWEGSTGGGTWRLTMITEGISIMDWEGERVQPQERVRDDRAPRRPERGREGNRRPPAKKRGAVLRQAGAWKTRQRWCADTR